MSRLERLVERVRTDVSRWRVPPGRPHVVHTRTQGFELLVRADEDVGRAIHFARSFEVPETDYLRSVIRPDAVCADVGANVGYFTMLMASVARQGVVHAFEPLPLNVALIAASTGLNRFTNIRLNQTAVGDAPGEVEFAEAADSAYSSMHDTGRKGVEARFTVPVTTLDAYFGGGAVDVLKVDVEGAEALVMAGARALLADPARRPTVILIELFQPNLDVFGASVTAIVAELTDLGYRAQVLGEAGLVDYDAATSRQYNLVFTAARG